MRKVYSHLSAQERIRIDELRNREGLGVRQIALRMGRDKSTVSRELRCGLWFASDENESHRPYRPKQLKTGAWTSRPFYSAMTAQRKAERRARQWIYAKPRRALDLRQYLPRGKRHRTRARGRRSKGSRIPMRVPIADRPKCVDSRREFGHYESDTVVGASPSRRCIDTQVERRSRRLFARFVPDKSALATARAEYDWPGVAIAA